MRHRKQTAKLGRSSAHRKALLRNMVTSLLEHERIQTTHAKAREVRRTAERMITLGKRGDLHARRRALRVIRSRAVAAKVFDDLALRFRERPGGYTRVLKLGPRVGDAAPMSIVELVEGAPAKAAKTAAKPEKAAKPARKAAARPAKAAKEEKPRTRRKAKSQKAEKADKPKKKASSTRAKAKKAAKPTKAGRKKTTRKKSS